MNIKLSLDPVSAEDKELIDQKMKSLLDDREYEEFVKYVKPYEAFGFNQLDDIFVIARLAIEGGESTTIKEIEPTCVVDQKDWQMYESEPDIAIDPVRVPLTFLYPEVPAEIESGDNQQTLFVVLRSGGNLIDMCKDLPGWVWDKREFEFVVSMKIVTKYGEEYSATSNNLIGF